MSLFVENRIILDLCGGTGAWSAPYKEAGYNVRLVTLPDQDVRLLTVPDEEIWGILAAPPCDHLAISGARWWKGKGEGPLLDGLAVVDACLRIIHACKPQWWVLENPVGRLIHYLGPPQFSFQPYEYGDHWSKRTLLWGRFNIPISKNPVEPTEGSLGMKHSGQDPRTKILRSITPPGFAKAFFEVNP